MLMLKSTHEAIVAAKDDQIAGLMKRISTLEGCLQVGRVSEQSMIDNIMRLREQVAGLSEDVRQAEASSDALTVRLAVFTAPRARNAKGHFISAKGASA